MRLFLEVVPDEMLLISEGPSRVAFRRGPFQADGVLPRGQGRIQNEKTQDVPLRIMEEKRHPVKRDDSPDRLSNGMEKSLPSQVGDHRVVDLEKRAAALRRRGDRRVECSDLLVRLHIVDGDGDLIGDLHEQLSIRLAILVLCETSHRYTADALSTNYQGQRA